MIKNNMPSNQQVKIMLGDFWLKFGKDGHKYFVCKKNKSLVVKHLSILSTINFSNRRGLKLSECRDKFNHVKWKRHSLKSHSICFICHLKAEIRHHIIPLKNGGLNSRRNLISLCNRCHRLIHPWLNPLINNHS